MRFVNAEGITFDDVLLVPRYCDIESRMDVSLETRLTAHLYVNAPIVASNMDTVSESGMVRAMDALGCTAIMHRFMDIEVLGQQLESFRYEYPKCIAVSIGVNNRIDDLLTLYESNNVDVICIDVAHGHNSRVLAMIKKIKNGSGRMAQVIAGNVATPEATKQLCDAGADAIKVGIGPGSLCTTRIVTGCGVPQLSAISECATVAEDYGIPIIADGGIRNSGDIVKALAAGASTVMVGSLIAGTDETPGEIIDDIRTGERFKKYRGMASDDAMVGWKGRGYHAAAEGEVTLVPYKGPVSKIVNPLLAGVRSGMTYCGARTIKELQEKAVFRRISSNCLMENLPHGKH